jgi:hypothetical protein
MVGEKDLFDQLRELLNKIAVRQIDKGLWHLDQTPRGCNPVGWKLHILRNRITLGVFNF